MGRRLSLNPFPRPPQPLSHDLTHPPRVTAPATPQAPSASHLSAQRAAPILLAARVRGSQGTMLSVHGGAQNTTVIYFVI